MSDFEEKERAWQRMAEAAKRRKHGLHSDESEKKSSRKGGLKWVIGKDLRKKGMS